MLEALKREAALTHTENGALTYSTSLSDCLDLFYNAGALRNAEDERITSLVMRAFAEDPVRALRIIFFARDIREGMGERRFFRAAIRYLAKAEPEAVQRNLHLIPEYGRWDDLLVLLDTPCEEQAAALIKAQLDSDIAAMNEGREVSLLGKWLPSVNTSSSAARAAGRRLAKSFGMKESEYRKTLSALRRHIAIIENNLREKDYTFDYEKQPSKALFKYRAAFGRNDEKRYSQFLKAVEEGKSKLNTSALYPYDIVHACMSKLSIFRSAADKMSPKVLDLSWKNLPVYGTGSENCLAIVDGSGSMYRYGSNVSPIDVAVSLGLYFAEHTTGGFAGHFITFSENPRLVEVKGKDILQKVEYCASYNEAANTNIEAVFDLLLNTAVKNSLPQEDMPSKLIIISDMEFDWCAEGGNDMTVFETFRKKYSEHGYKLPQIVFWNVESRRSNVPVTFSDTGCALVSGMSSSLFNIVTGDDLDPVRIMDRAIMGERYEAVR